VGTARIIETVGSVPISFTPLLVRTDARLLLALTDTRSLAAKMRPIRHIPPNSLVRGRVSGTVPMILRRERGRTCESDPYRWGAIACAAEAVATLEHVVIRVEPAPVGLAAAVSALAPDPMHEE